MLRWFDLVRTGKLVERVREHNPYGAPNIQEHHVLRPIPQDQIDRTSSEFAQNLEY
ncbi:RagB/SusD family nutrient uptake outer membrane protein [Pontibacter silvestris]|uniref:RagB/SusD family nutrient uptake outer membrane protein n=1 Tax=Pontibacter silvestris TaxID=2305183 RepID=A0ABW4X3G6_9BACT|nr:RagB/SusD family nutrient uptake outer membrane protein [Pontibacter silvestris]